MKSILFATLFLFARAAFGQASGQVRTVSSISEMCARVPVVSERIVVAGEHGPRTFTAVSSLPSGGTNLAHVFASGTTNKWWVSDDQNARPQNAKVWGMVGDGVTDNSSALEALLSYSRDIELPRGRYALSRPVRLTNAESVSITSADGSYQGGYHSTNLVTKAEFLYTGPATNVFFDFTPGLDGGGTQMLRYGNTVENISFNANGLADVATKIGYLGRGRFVGCRFNGGTGVNWLLNASQFVTFIDCSTSRNDETPTPTVFASYGLSLTNFSPANVFIDCQIENSSVAGVTLWGNARNNSFIGGAIESNFGDGLVLEAGAGANTFTGIWMENNAGTNSIWVKAGALQNSFDALRSYEDIGWLRVAGNYNTFQNFGATKIWIEPTGTRNKWINMIYVATNGLIDQTYGGQMFVDMINATATIRTNTLSSPFVQYGEPFKLWNATNLHERTALRYGQLGFGDGSNPVDWTLQRFSASVGGTTNEFRVQVPYAAFPGISILNLENNTATSMTLSADELAFGPGSATRDTSWRRRGVSNWVTTAEVWISRLTNEVALSTTTPESTVTNPFLIRGDGSQEWGPGTAIRTAALRYDSPGTLRLTTNLVVDGAITLGGVARTTWPSGSGGTNSSRVFWKGTMVNDPNFEDTATVETVSPTSTTNLALRVVVGSIGTDHMTPAAIAWFASAANAALTGTPTVNGTNFMALLNGKIDTDPDLVAISALTGTGLMARTGAGSYVERTITGDSEITVSNGNGVSGNPTLAIGAAIARVAAMAATYQPLHAVLTRLSGIGLGVSGDIIYRDANGWTNLAKGSDGQVLKLASGLPAWGTDSTSGGGAGDVYQSSNNVFTATNTFTKSLLVSNTVENRDIVFVGTNAAAGTSKNAGHLGVWDNGDAFGALRLAATDGHLRLQVWSTNLEAHTGFNFTNAPRSQWIVHRDATGNGETYQEGRGPNMSAGGDATEYYRLLMKATGFYLMTGKGQMDFLPASGLFRVQGPGTAFVAPSAGEGLEFFYDSTNALWGAGGAGSAGISVYDRSASIFGDLRFNARQTRLQVESVDLLSLSNGLVTVSGALKVGTTNVTDELALKAPLASPALTGNPTAPTATAGDADTSVATTAFVSAAVAVGTTNYPAGKTVAFFTAPQAHAPASNPASYGTRNAIPVLEFDHTTQEQSRWVINLPVGYAASTAAVVLRWTTTATSGDGRMGARFWKVTGVDVDTDDFATAVEATTTCSATAGTTVVTTLSAVNLDGLVGGEVGILEVYRDNGDAADTINSNDIQLMSVEVRAE